MEKIYGTAPSFWDFKGEGEYTDRKFLMSTPFPIALTLTLYLWFVLKIGPELMKSRKPFNLTNTIVAYNIVQVLISCHIVQVKERQVTFLHVYHHTIMVICTWSIVKYIKNDSTVFFATINSLVHVVMYAYYALSVYPSLTKYLWWKKYITIMQLQHKTLSA
ncbi:Elongation of very long chain fatty acids protein [Operophtera brumata]|uniref:Elongation of very long chain fatty acids protein n=1 Tax=Operophtera brumata TaxID=104452 RepID=A0A0L7LJB9_OPEBR|nr:Elongation of very long chain fatty acids protein [Operophtera brumata]